MTETSVDYNIVVLLNIWSISSGNYDKRKKLTAMKICYFLTKQYLTCFELSQKNWTIKKVYRSIAQ